jgi:nucleoside-diphosphate-sugar epimerase
MNVDVVTGAAGLIGRALVAELRRQGSWVRGVDLGAGDPNLDIDDYVRADLRDPSQASGALSRPGGGSAAVRVWHLAAHHGGVAYMRRNGPAVLADNVRIDANVTLAAETLGYDRVLYASSVAVYPTTPDSRRTAEADAHPAMPPDGYGWAKLTGERLVTSTRNPRIARLENCYGPPAADPERDGVLLGLCRRAAAAEQGSTLDVWGDPATERAFLWVDDAVRALVAVMSSDREAPVNVSSGEYVTIGHVAQLVCDVSGKNIRPRPTSEPSDGVAGRQRPHLDDRVIRSLGWSPQVTLDQGIRRLYSSIDVSPAEVRS